MKKEVIFFFATVCVQSLLLGGNPLTKLFVHQGMLSDKVVMQFKQKPVCTYVPEKEEIEENGHQKLSFIVPMVEAKNDTLSKCPCNEMYTMSCNQITVPIQGIKCTIAFDTHSVGVEHESFEAITGERGVVFTIYNLAVLRGIGEKHRTITRVAARRVKKK